MNERWDQEVKVSWSQVIMEEEEVGEVDDVSMSPGSLHLRLTLCDEVRGY